MIGLDTNVLLRLFIEDDLAQCERARRFVEAATKNDVCFVNPIVFAEFVWTLARRMKRTKAEVVTLIEQLLLADDLEISHHAAASRALSAFRIGRADFADYFLAGINEDQGCSSTATFDGDALDSKSFSPVP